MASCPKIWHVGRCGTGGRGKCPYGPLLARPVLPEKYSPTQLREPPLSPVVRPRAVAGLFELFIDDRLDLPNWLEIHDLNDLKEKLIGVIIVVLAVLFLGQVATWDGVRDLLGYGTATALVIAALTWFVSQKGKKERDKPGA